MVTYGTFQQLSEQLVNNKGDVRALTRDVFKNGGTGAAIGGGAAAKASGSAAGQSQKKPKKQSATGQNRILLVDEVDVLLTPSFYGETYDAEVLIQLHNIADLQKLAWKMKMEGGDLKLILPALKVAEAYDELLRDHAGVKNILNAQIAKMCSDLEAWVNGGRDESFRDYQIIDGKVAYKKGVAYDSKISLGYVTLWAYFSEVESKRVPDATLEEHLGLRINCGQFSYAEIPKRYELILGVTGTLVPEMPGGPEPLGCFEQDIIREDYKIVGKTELPSVFGQRNLTFRENEVQRQRQSQRNKCTQMQILVQYCNPYEYIHTHTHNTRAHTHTHIRTHTYAHTHTHILTTHTHTHAHEQTHSRTCSRVLACACSLCHTRTQYTCLKHGFA